MRLFDFDLNLLVYMEALLTEKSVSLAAHRVHITQPALSLALARLREHFEDELLVKVGGRKMVLTPLAESLVDPVHEALMYAEKVAAARERFSPAVSSRKFVIMATDYVVDVLLQLLLQHCHSKAPHVQFEIRRLSAKYRERIREEQDLDLLIVPEPWCADDLPSEPALEDAIVCVVWSRNRLVGRELTREQYGNLGHVCSSLSGPFDDHLRAFGLTRKKEIMVPDLCMLPKLVCGTNRIATMFRRIAEQQAKQYSLRILEPPVEFPKTHERMQWLRHKDKEPGLVWLRKTIRELSQEI